ncbi:MAG TPA: SUF system NifU family Fe-S cluster assembly protein [Candidatus Paceibacterota bacterium]|nr:SUF system NifU family Fe-S cluster assembly protein [Verrucomicrobiota bacterium]HRY47528.1 SUF system NifU family Fe-S cluster assembly protein [Candidatus Paceibacterota bacterium]HSA03809.1 SUF system NifU family Fe-S cluster assembly protein [Candidatus Paceibacterota bacterium]
MIDNLNDLYQEVILDHSRHPRNYQKLAKANREAHGHNPLCGDQLTVYVQLDGDRIRDISFEGSGCAISKAAASVMTTLLKGKTSQEARDLFSRFHHMVTEGHYQECEHCKLAAFAGVHKFPARVKCAMLPWRTLEASLADKPSAVSTE